MMQTQTWTFGRLNIISAYNMENKKNLIMRGLGSNETVEGGQSKWTFANVKEFINNNEEFIYGTLVRYAPRMEEIMNEETHQIETREIRGRLLGQVLFFIHVESGIISYHIRGKQISKTQFIDKSCEVFRKGFNDFLMDVDIQAIQDSEYEFSERLMDLSRVESIRISLHPSNPSSRPEWDDIDQELKELGAKSYTEDLRAAPNSNGLNQSSLLNHFLSKIQMSIDGYGLTVVKGVDQEGREKTISTKNNPMTVSVKVDDMKVKDDKQVENLLDQLSSSFRAIFSRFNH